MKVILKRGQKPSDILLQQNIKKDTIVAYLEETGIRVGKEQSKDACVKQCLEKWHVKDDMFWVKRPRSEERVLGDLSLSDNCMNKETEKVSRKHCTKNLRQVMLTEVLEPIREHNILPQFKKQKEDCEGSHVLSPTEIHKNLSTKKTSNSSVKAQHRIIAPSVSRTTEGKRESASFIESPHISRESVHLFGELSDLSSDSSEPEINRSASPPMTPCCTSAQEYQGGERQSIFTSKTLNSISSGDSFSEMILPRPPSTEPFSFSQQSLDVDHIPSVKMMENKSKSISDAPDSVSASSRWIHNAEWESYELSSTQPFSISIERDNLPTVNVADNKRSVSPTVSSASPRWTDAEEHESSKVMQTYPTKSLVCSTSVSDASVQTLLTEFPELQGNGSTVSQKNQNRISSLEKAKELSLSGENLCPTKMLYSKRRVLEHPETGCVIFHDKNQSHSPSLSKKEDCIAGIPDAKRSRWASRSNHCASDLRNVNRSGPSCLECLSCKEQRFSSCFLRADGNEPYISPKPQPYKKKPSSSLSKDVPSRGKKRRLIMPSKRAKKASFVPHESRRPSTLMTKTKTFKRKYNISSPIKEMLPPHENRHLSTFSSKQSCCSSAISSERNEQSKLPFKKMNFKTDNALVKPENEDEASVFQSVNRQSIVMEQTTFASESTTGCLPPENPTVKITESPRRSSSAPPELLRGSKSTLKSPDFASGIPDENENSPTEDPAASDIQKPLPPNKRHCCKLI